MLIAPLGSMACIGQRFAHSWQGLPHSERRFNGVNRRSAQPAANRHHRAKRAEKPTKRPFDEQAGGENHQREHHEWPGSVHSQRDDGLERLDLSRDRHGLQSVQGGEGQHRERHVLQAPQHTMSPVRRRPLGQLDDAGELGQELL